MAGSSFGTIFRITTWGESHGKAVGVTVDGVPAGLALSEEDIQRYLDRRKPGQNRFTTARSEADQAEILSGIFEGKTTGTPISILVRNQDQRSRDYSEISAYYRPGHADLAYDLKYGFRDYRGGGRSSGRETIGRVAGGAIALKILQEMGIRVCAYVSAIGPVRIAEDHPDLEYLKESMLCMPDAQAEKEARAYLDWCIREQTSAGGMITCRVQGLPAGIGEPVFDKLDALLGKALFSIGAVKAVEIGSGVGAALMTGDQHNDGYITENGTVKPESSHAGGILGGISNGQEVVIRIAVKPTPSIAKEQHALFRDGSCQEISIKGRHDPVIAPRAAVVAEAMTGITLLDLMMINMSSTMDAVRRFYGKGTD